MRRIWNALSGLLEVLPGGRVLLSVETLIAFASLYFALFCNVGFFSGLLAGYDPISPATWFFALSGLLIVVALHNLIFGLFMNRWTAKPLLALLFVATAFAVHFMSRYRVYLDISMLRNVLATDVGEVRDLMTWSLLPPLLFYAALPLFALSRVELRARPLARAALLRGAFLGASLVVLVGGVMANFQDLASVMRNQRELRFLLTPANYLYSTPVALIDEADATHGPRKVIGADAAPGPSWSSQKKPVLMVMVLGETLRAANWGLSGYERQTTPELAALGVIDFADVTSCGTNTETSLPCIFSPWGRRDYNEARIRGSENVLDVAKRAGFRVVWLDNQSGCKGVCAGVEYRPSNPKHAPQLCVGGSCQDGVLVEDLRRLAAETPGNLLVVMHQMGNHGPAYFKRYPPEFRHYTPACEDNDLQHCQQDSIVNAYDNAVRYTDHVLADTVRFLRSQQTHDAAMLYVSDHGESLGESGLFLHGIPYAIAPDTQTKVPMVMWLSDAFERRFGIDGKCLQNRATQPARHDHIFHSLLGLLDIETTVYERPMDLSAGCRQP